MDCTDHEMLAAVVRRVRTGSLEAFLAQEKGCGWCRHPIRLRSAAACGEGAERRLDFSCTSLPDGVALKACGSRPGALPVRPSTAPTPAIWSGQGSPVGRASMRRS